PLVPHRRPRRRLRPRPQPARRTPAPVAGTCSRAPSTEPQSPSPTTRATMSESALQEYAVRVGSYPAYIYDLPGLAEHAAAIRAALPGTEIYYAAKANPDAEILRTLAPHVDGVEVSSGGELDHVRTTLPGMPVAFGGPGKTTEELSLAQRLKVERIHVESP